VNEWVGSNYPNFHRLKPTEQIVRLVYFHTVVEGRESVSSTELVRLFDFVEVPTPENLQRLLLYLSRNGRRLLHKAGEYSLRREVRQLITDEIARHADAPLSISVGRVAAFEFPGKTFQDSKITTLIEEARRCYATGCWNACGILVRIVLERSLDTVGQSVKSANGLKDKLNYCISNPAGFAKSIVEALKELKGAKLVGDIVAHHSDITLDKHDVDVVAAPFRMFIKEIKTV